MLVQHEQSWSSFRPELVSLLVQRFGRERLGTVTLYELNRIVAYILERTRLFDRIKIPHAETMSVEGLTIALTSSGYRLGVTVTETIFTMHAGPDKDALDLHGFIHCCVVLEHLTDEFKRIDVLRRGVIDVGFEEFGALWFLCLGQGHVMDLY